MIYGDVRIPERVWRNIYPEPNTGCWLWAGRADQHGYGSLMYNGKRGKLHRYTLWIETGYFGEYALHGCDTPACCNPEHLRWGDNSENQVDSVRRGSHHEARKTHCPQGHEYNQANTYVRPDNPNRRDCRVCRNKRAMDRYYRVSAQH